MLIAAVVVAAAMIDWLCHYGCKETADALLGLAALGYVIATGLYWVLFWSHVGRGRTLGMRALGIRLIGRDGRAPSIPIAALRLVLVVLLTFPVALYGSAFRNDQRDIYVVLENAQTILWLVLAGSVIFTPSHRGLHDRIAGTTVVQDDERRWT